ncbi:replicative DNA helicase [Sphingomonas sp. S17]|uniref:Replicative DNA helicase n=3 Tax=Sphingomonas TaxID=13687 RepID=A0A411LMN1_SPHPI|nr:MULTISPECIES: replicative DNA helicase [Sphingomonas]EGI55190.1 replicative DNA helicase [Sphingomonas sp. S17]MBQ1480801.1 replicative DNA helicase [Sphingomonas sp.]MCM3679785.1 replicative DNA helicase [Sphingomonas paucimobilis]MDG5970822.1 replicative DNA helicase [Sphingomonas paucimobilis]NNG56806.1 replicative DNA helicase [Sphingomonas paucimobilis]
MATLAFPNPAAATEPQQLPRNIEAEAALLGAMMIDNRLADDLVDRLDPDHFFEPVHGRVFAAIKNLRATDMLATPVTLRPMFEADEGMKALGGPSYLAQLTGSGAGLIGARQFATQIYDLAMLRALVTVGRTLVDRAMDTSEEVNPRAQIELAENELFKVAADGGSENAVKSFAQATTMAVKNAERALNSGGHVSGITTGLDSVNAKIGGMHRSDLMILAGRPGMGKTSLATNIAFNAARRWMRDMQDGIPPAESVGAKVAFFSLEMSADQLATRILAEQSGISSEALRMGKISRNEFAQLAAAAAELEQLPLFIDDTGGLSISALHTRVRRLQRRHNNEIGLVVVDYLQLLTGSGKQSDGNRVQEISEISRGLKTLAKDMNVPVLALSQLSRAVEQREDKRPMLSDLRESGSIEQDADMVWFVFREDYYMMQREPKRPMEGDDGKVFEDHAKWATEVERVYGLAELIVAKQRHGATGKVVMKFDPTITRFTDFAGY